MSSDRRREPILCHPPGHFYSPITDPADLEECAANIWKPRNELSGIDFRRDEHRRLLSDVIPSILRDYDYPEEERDKRSAVDFFSRNNQFGWLDARMLFAFLRHLRPRRVIEVGSGFSSLLMADVNRRWFESKIEITCIEPYPREFLKAGVPGITQLVCSRVQLVEPSFFEGLESGDILFVDSSHVAKTGSDVNHLIFEVLPMLNPGVHIHFHDVFLPREYLKRWAIDENRSWNEQYMLQALLMYSTAFRVMFGCYYAFTQFPELVASALGVPERQGFGGGSFWIDRV